jgi:hypothetical protein
MPPALSHDPGCPASRSWWNPARVIASLDEAFVSERAQVDAEVAVLGRLGHRDGRAAGM